MKTPRDADAITDVVERLGELFDAAPDRVDHGPHSGEVVPDAVVSLRGLTLLIEWKRSGAAASVAAGIDVLERWRRQMAEPVVPLLAVPYMGDVGRELCAAREIAWIDLSGNARIDVGGFRVLVDGRSNLYKKRGRPSTVFAAKSSRVSRWLLMHPTSSFSQRTIAEATGLDEGYTSKIVRRLLDDRLVVRHADNSIQVRDVSLLLDSWWDEYDFSKHEILRGHVPARTGTSLLDDLTTTLVRTGIEYAATGLAAAWLIDRFADFRLVTVFLAERPADDLLDSLGFRGVDSGANVWLAVANDEGVFQGAERIDEIRCVHPIQAFLDLKAQPERAQVAAEHLRQHHLAPRDSHE